MSSFSTKALVYTLHKFEKKSVLYVKYCGGDDKDFIGGEGFFLTSCFQSLSGRLGPALRPSQHVLPCSLPGLLSLFKHQAPSGPLHMMVPFPRTYPVLVRSGCHNKVQKKKSVWLKRQIYIVSWYWRQSSKPRYETRICSRSLSSTCR